MAFLSTAIATFKNANPSPRNPAAGVLARLNKLLTDTHVIVVAEREVRVFNTDATKEKALAFHRIGIVYGEAPPIKRIEKRGVVIVADEPPLTPIPLMIDAATIAARPTPKSNRNELFTAGAVLHNLSIDETIRDQLNSALQVEIYALAGHAAAVEFLATRLDWWGQTPWWRKRPRLADIAILATLALGNKVTDEEVTRARKKYPLKFQRPGDKRHIVKPGDKRRRENKDKDD